MQYEYDLELVGSLKVGEECYFAECEGSAGRIVREGEMYLLYSIPMYGGEERFESASKSYVELVDLYYSFT